MHNHRRYRSTFLLLLAFLLSASAFGQSPADRFFQQIFRQHPDSYFPVKEGGDIVYEENYANGYKTRQSFLLVDPYASGKARFLKTVSVEDMETYLPGVVFFLGELNCNLEFNDGKLPFIGFSDEKAAGIVLPSRYDVFNSAFLGLLSRPKLDRQGQQEKYAEALAMLFAHIRLKQENCEDEILEFSKPKTKWNGSSLNLKMSYDLKCQIGESIEWGPKSFQLDFDFEFKEGRLAGIVPLAWP